jgi:beta-glucosidase
MWVSAVVRRALVPALILGCAAPAVAADQRPWTDRSKSPDDRAAAVVSELTLVEKVNLVTGLFGCVPKGSDGFALGVPRLGIPDLAIVGAGMGVSGGICPNRANGGKATLLPSPLAMAASWDPQVAYEDGALIGRETRATGFNVSIGGAVNLARDPRSGRTFEGEGEDPVLAGTMVGHQLKGTQDEQVVATIKHFALNNEEKHRLTASSEIDERTMRELELRAFELGLETSGAGAVMCSYNKVNGDPACENEHLLTDVLRRDWGFKGWVMTDWWACTIPAVFDPADMCDAAGAALAGLDQQMPNASFFGPPLLAAVLAGRVPQVRLDEMVHRIVRTMYASGIADDPPQVTPLDAEAGASVAQRAAERSAVLLRNERAVLPLRRSVRSIAVLGAPANEASPHPGSPLAIPPTDDGSSVHVEPLVVDTPLEGLRDTAPDARITYRDGTDRAAAAQAAREADVAIVYARDTQGEGKDLAALTLDDDADGLIAAVAKANPRTVVVLMTGTAATMRWVDDVPAVLEAWRTRRAGCR